MTLKAETPAAIVRELEERASKIRHWTGDAALVRAFQRDWNKREREKLLKRLDETYRRA